MSLRTVILKTRVPISNYLHGYKLSVNKSCTRYFQSTSVTNFPRRPPGSGVQDKPIVNLDVTEKYKIFDDKDAVVIQNTSEELLADQLDEDDYEEFQGLNLERGINGVFEIEELVNILRSENAKDIFVSAVPSHITFSDYICIVTGRSAKHNLAMAEFLRKLFKRKRHPKDVLPKIEGEDFKDWIALDLGNIVLHIFNAELRQYYDLEQLWSVGHQYDEQSRKHLETIEIIDKRSILLEGLIPKEDK